ncbi:MAG: YeeE/YedE family protein [Gammaproteobacteria bacterium TMED163]|nr:MAG: YeeE/YedE family protein [Gammaproteobacteria bacterium TMED163]RPG46391.1 MAG: YeeE/YedE family protein [Gammaproteobacteria bacterium TMED163]|tara:strand:- start:512 stop:1693 length:1182 start_codon:yes stop_codon:yes gene_type:complete
MSNAATLTPEQTRRNQLGLIVSASIAALLYLYLYVEMGWRQASLFLVGLAAGVILYHAAFGFTGAWREVAKTGRSAGLRAQMVMLGVTVLIFTPLISVGEIGGIALRGSVAPVNLGVVCGAFLFGIGMQLGGGCASGTLFTAGGGNVRMLVTLASFIAGSVLGTFHWQSWQGVPGFEPMALSRSFGVVGGVLISMVLFAGVYLAAAAWEKCRHGDLLSTKIASSPTLLRGPWPLIAGALALTAVNVATLLLAGRPWGVTAAFALWGAKILGVVGLDISHWAYWSRPNSLASLNGSLFNDITSVMNFGIMLGALMAASLAHKFSPSMRIPARSLLAAVVGGLMLGYGARIAFGCNIGAYFGGISSTSLHGWLWFVAAFAGSSIGTRLRPWFGLD